MYAPSLRSPSTRHKQYCDGDHTSSYPSFFSFSESGRHRTTTFTHSLRAVRGRADFSIFDSPCSLRKYTPNSKSPISIHSGCIRRHHLFGLIFHNSTHTTAQLALDKIKKHYIKYYHAVKYLET